MRGSHAPSLRTIVARTMREEAGLLPGTTVLCACSGGPDSTAMLHVLASLREELGLTIVGHGVDHGLREEARAELELAASVASSLGVPFGVSRVEVPAGANLQARARDARYEALEAARLAAGAEVIATAHTAEDRAETVLLRLFRGAGARGLAVLPVREGHRLRPLVRARRAAVHLHLERHRVPSADDPSNLDPRFARVRVRSTLLPALEREAPRIVETLASLADELCGLDLGGSPLAALGRRQREQVLRAVRHGKVGRAQTSDDEEVLVTLESDEPVITKVRSSPGPRHRSRGRSEPSRS